MPISDAELVALRLRYEAAYEAYQSFPTIPAKSLGVTVP
jgi:hypothetical protein